MQRCGNRTTPSVARVGPRGGDFEQSRAYGMNRVSRNLLRRESLPHRRERGRVVAGTFQCPYGDEIRLSLVLIVVGPEIGTDPKDRSLRQNAFAPIVNYRCEHAAAHRIRDVGPGGGYLCGRMSK